jgi:hypothetical protein
LPKEIQKTYQNAKVSSTELLGGFLYFMGLCFMTWASRIPDIKTALDLGSELGTILSQFL